MRSTRWRRRWTRRRRPRASTPPARAGRSRRVGRASRPLRAQQREVIIAFGRAAREGDLAGLLSLLHPDVVFTSDGGGLVTAPRKPIEGADRVARTVKALSANGGAGVSFDIVDVNGMPGFMAVGGDGVATVMSFTVDDGRIVAVDVQRNPEKLRKLP